MTLYTFKICITSYAVHSTSLSILPYLFNGNDNSKVISPLAMDEHYNPAVNLNMYYLVLNLIHHKPYIIHHKPCIIFQIPNESNPHHHANES